MLHQVLTSKEATGVARDLEYAWDVALENLTKVRKGAVCVSHALSGGHMSEVEVYA